MLLMAIWVLAPFAAVVVLDRVSTRWPARVRTTLHALMLALTVGSLAVYVYDAWRPRASQPAARFVAAPVASCVVIALVLAIAALISRRRPTPAG